MDFFEVVRKRRSTRRLRADPVPEDDLLAILEAARLSPNAHNQQAWHFIVIRDHDLKQELKSMVNAVMDFRIEVAPDEATKRGLARDRFPATNFASAPVVVVALGQPVSPHPSEWERPFSWVQSIAAAVAQMHLAATAFGYGSFWSTAPLKYAQEEIEALLGVQRPWFALAILSLGIPARTPGEIARKPLREIVTFR